MLIKNVCFRFEKFEKLQSITIADRDTGHTKGKTAGVDWEKHFSPFPIKLFKLAMGCTRPQMMIFFTQTSKPKNIL